MKSFVNRMIRRHDGHFLLRFDLLLILLLILVLVFVPLPPLLVVTMLSCNTVNRD